MFSRGRVFNYVLPPLTYDIFVDLMSRRGFSLFSFCLLNSKDLIGSRTNLEIFGIFYLANISRRNID
jgi:hypothetical protein